MEDEKAGARRRRRLRALHQPRPQQTGRAVNVNGEIGAVFLYKTALSDAERQELVNFAAAKLVAGGESDAAK